MTKHNWKCEHCGFEASSQTSCCYEAWSDAADVKMGSFWFIGSAIIVAIAVSALLWWLLV